MEATHHYKDLIAQIGNLKSALTEAQETIKAITTGEVDAFIVNNGKKHEIYTLKNAGLPYRIFIRKVSAGTVTLSSAGKILYANANFAEIMNTSMQNMIGQSFEELFPPAFKPLIVNLVKRAWLKESEAEIILQHQPGKPITVLLSFSSVEINGQKVLSVVITNLSAQPEQQEEKIQVEKKDEFITIASHELRTPVTSIKGYIQLLRYNFKQQGNDMAADLLGKADMQINKLTNLITHLLDVKKIETGQLQYTETVFDFNKLADEIIKEETGLIKSHTITYSPTYDCNVYGDRNKIGQVIVSFIDNAVKYSPAGTTIFISSIQHQDTVRLSVKDLGIGVPMEQQQKIFERFYRVKGEKENTYGGLGLGLYISSAIIQWHKGAIGVESEMENGATFYFEIPVYKPQD